MHICIYIVTNNNDQHLKGYTKCIFSRIINCINCITNDMKQGQIILMNILILCKVILKVFSYTLSYFKSTLTIC
jgi:hypothetical protein